MNDYFSKIARENFKHSDTVIDAIFNKKIPLNDILSENGDVLLYEVLMKTKEFSFEHEIYKYPSIDKITISPSYGDYSYFVMSSVVYRDSTHLNALPFIFVGRDIADDNISDILNRFSDKWIVAMVKYFYQESGGSLGSLITTRRLAENNLNYLPESRKRVYDIMLKLIKEIKEGYK